MHFLNIPANYNFLKSLSFYIRNTFKNNLEMSKITVLLPSRYSSNELKRVFLENGKDDSIILPTIKAIGDIDYDDLLLNNINLDNFDENIIKTTSAIKYKLLLIKEVLKNQQNINIEKAINLAQDLDLFLNEVEKNNLNLDDLDNIVDEEYSIHWQKILDFIKVFGKKWQQFLQENNIISNNFHSLAMIKSYIKLMENTVPEHPLIIAGNFLSVRNTMELVKILKKYDNTYFVFKGFENKLTDEGFENLECYYSHYYFKNIVKELEIDKKDIETIEFEDCKIVEKYVVDTLNKAMLPANMTYLWYNDSEAKVPENITYIECKNNFEELNLIAFYLVDFFNKNGLKNIAIITTNDYAHEIEIFLKKWNLPINNNFGINFSSNDLVKYLFLVVNTYKNDFAVEFLLSLLKNDYTTFDYNKNELNYLIELFEEKVLNSSEINIKDINSYRKNINKLENDNIKKKLNDFIDKIELFFDDFKKINNMNFANVLDLHIKIAEKIAGKNSPFYDKKNEKVLEYIKEMLEQGDCFENIDLEDYSSLLLNLFAEHSYRENYTLYPAVNIITAEESRLVNYDLVIIPNLNDGIFPKNISTDPYMSKSMRKKFKLPPKEIEIGRYCYDFIQLLSQKEVLLTRAEKNSNEATIKSRFLQKLEIYLETNGKKLKTSGNIINLYNSYINRKYDNNNDKYKKKPCPQPEEKLTKLSATNIETLRMNPYDIYAKKILNLYKFNVISEKAGVAIKGTIIHKIFELYCKDYEKYKDKIENVDKLIEDVLEEYENDVLKELYFDSIKAIMQTFIEYDNKSRLNGYNIFEEETKSCFLEEANFTLSAKIDRIESNRNTIKIIDYKTGGEITKSKVENGKKLQLLLEAIILIEINKNITVEEVQYWMTKCKNSEIIKISLKEKNADLIEKTKDLILRLLYIFNEEKRGYFATAKNIEYSDYTLLARVKEWE